MSAPHIAVIAPPMPGHVNPLIALAAALGERGHRVTLVHLADAARLVGGSPLGFAPLGGAGDRAGVLDAYLDRLARPTGPVGLVRMIRATAGITGLLLDALPDALKRIGAEAVIADSAEAAGGLVARQLGLPFVTSVTGLPLLRDRDVPPPFVPWDYRADDAGRHRNRAGYAVADLLMRPITRTVARRAAAWGLEVDDGYSPLLQVAQCPEALDFRRSALPAAFRYGAPWRLPETPAPRPTDDARPLVFCSLGTLQGSRKALLAAMTQACADAGARAVVAHGGGLGPAEEAALPGDPLIRAFWPQRAVLPHCAAAILHGGFNSVLDALAAGVPSVAVPIAFEQPATAARLRHWGAGAVVPVRRASARALGRALAEVLTDERYRHAAERLGATFAGSDGARDAAALVSAALADATA